MIVRAPGILVALWLSVALLNGCGQSTTAKPAGVLDVTVSIVPQKYFVERIGGDYVVVNVMVRPGDSPATYEPRPEQLTALSEADVYFSIGVPFENAWLDRVASANPGMLMVDTAKGIEHMAMTTQGRHGEEERHEEEEHREGGPDPHIWVSPELVKVQSQTIYEALAQLDPEHREAYRANLDSFIADIDALEADIRSTLEGVENKRFMVFHPSWGYFARDFGLEQLPVEVGGQEPSAAELADLITVAKEKGIRVIFAQPEFSTRDAETIASEIGGEVLLISPLHPDWLNNLRNVADTFEEVLDH